MMQINLPKRGRTEVFATLRMGYIASDDGEIESHLTVWEVLDRLTAAL
jgi:hypothetical protein